MKSGKGNAIMKLSTLYKDLYNHEVEIRNYYDSKTEYIFVILGVEAAALAKYYDDYVNNASEGFVKFKFIVLCCALGIFVAQLVFLFKAFFSIKFKYMDFPVDQIRDDIVKHQKEMRNKKGNIGKMLDEYIDGMNSRTYEKCAKTYYITNIKKRKAHHVLYLLIFINFIFIILLHVMQ